MAEERAEIPEGLGDGPFAFPFVTGSFMCSGMALRDWFAGQALPSVIAMCAQDDRPDAMDRAEFFSRVSFGVADAMLAERGAVQEKAAARADLNDPAIIEAETALDQVLAKLDQTHHTYMIGLGRDPKKYTSKFSLAAATLREIGGGNG